MMSAPAFAAPTILFVTQPPYGNDFGTVNATFGNQQGITDSAPRGGDLYIRYGDGSLRNLTAEAGYGVGPAPMIGVREPSVHWSGTKALFSMVIGGTTIDDYSPVYWQIYEVAGLGKGQTVQITRLPQPATNNNVAPLYGTDDRVLFASDLPRNGNSITVPQLDEYESIPTVTGIWSMNPDGSDLKLLEHAVSGDFTPIIASDGRVIFTRWDHLQRDQQNNEGTEPFGAFNYASETSTVALSTNAEIFPELRVQPAGSYVHPHEFNHFFPWQMNEDGSALETLNHVGRHELASYFDSAHDGLPEFIAPTGRRTSDALLQIKEDPNRPGYFYATAAPEFGTHAAGQIIALNGAENVNADDMQIDYITDPLSRSVVLDGHVVPAGHPGHFRNPVPLSDGSLIAVQTTSAFKDATVSGLLSSRYDFHLVFLQPGTSYRTPGARLIAGGIAKSISYWDNYPYTQLSYNGPMWELDPVEVRARPRPIRHVNPLPAIETQILSDELGGQAGIDQLRTFLQSNNLALIVSRNVTRRADMQQDFNLKIAGSTTQTVQAGAVPIALAYLQLLQGDLIRGYSTFNAGRRPIAQLMHDGLNPAVALAPPSTVQLGSDGSFAAFVPARRALTWQLTQADGTPVIRERYWLTFAPGEMRTCTNCHGINRTDVVLGQPPPTNPPEALHTLARWWRDNLATSPLPTASVTPSAVPTTSATATSTAPPAPTSTPTGSVIYGIGGRVRYYSNAATVSGVTVQLQGNAPTTSQTDALGQFNFSNVAASPWQIVPKKLSDVGMGISSLDASYVLQAVVGLRTLTAQQQLACDVSGNGTLSALDASRILQYKVGLIPRFTVSETCGSDWAFIPVPAAMSSQLVIPPQMTAGACQAGAIAYQPLSGTALNQDFSAVLFGDCTGNWQPSPGNAAAFSAPAAPALRVGRVRRGPGKALRLALYADSEAALYGLDMRLTYDSTQLTVRRVRALRPGRALFQFNARIPDSVRISMASAQPIAHAGTPIAIVQFQARTETVAPATLRFLIDHASSN